MSLFEIELNSDFKILNKNVFFREKEFKKFYKLNTLNDGYDDNINDYLSDEYILKVESESILSSQDITAYYEIDEISNFIKLNNYNFDGENNNLELYPEWLLFYMAIKKNKVDFIQERRFNDNLIFFKLIAEIRHKQYVIRNISNFIPFNQYRQVDEFKERMHNEYLIFLDNLNLDKDALFEYLIFLYEMHSRLKEKEKYKLMWNIETYIYEAIQLLRGKDISIDDIYLRVSKGTGSHYSVLHDIYIYKPLYIKESQHYFQSYLDKINNVFGNDISIDDLMNTLITKEEYENLFFSYIELIKRFNSNKKSEVVMGSLTRSTMLDVEEVLRGKIGCTSPSLYKDCIKKICVGSHLLKTYYDLITPDMQNDDFFIELKKLCEVSDSLEKYLMIYYHSRNYLAHKNIDMHEFFRVEDGNRVIIYNVISSMLVILYHIEINNKNKS